MRKIWIGLAALILVAVGMPSFTGAARAQDFSTIGPDERILGKADAPVTIIEYASLTCPHCAAFDAETLPQLKKEWLDTGKAKLVFRDFPLDGLALKGAKLARCAPPERFYGFIDVLFRQQDQWARAGDPQAALGKIAKLGGMSDDQFKACMANDEVENGILAARMAAEKDAKVESTPTFYINGKKLVGALPYDTYDSALKAASKS